MITVKVDNAKALARFGPSGIPEAVRRNLRQVIPDLTRRLGKEVDMNLAAGLKSRKRLVTKTEMVENPTQLIGRVSVVVNAPPEMLPQWLEYGTAPHLIAAKNASVLFFYWEKLGRNVAFRQVNHPGFSGLQYMANAFSAMKGEIMGTLTDAVKRGAST